MRKIILLYVLIAFISTAQAANYNMSTSTQTLTCGSTHNFYDSGGSGSNYTGNQNLTMTFVAGTSGQCIQLAFTSFTTEATDDIMTVYDGTGTGGTVLGTFSGSTTPATITSYSGSITITFVSDNNSHMAGWVATLQCATCATPTILMSTATQTVTCGTTYNFYDNGGSGSSYSASASYTLTLTAGTAGQCVTVSFSAFNTESSYDILNVYDGTNTSATQLGSFSGSSTPSAVTSSSGSLTFVFTSDGSVNNAGWTATISCTSSCSTPPAAGYNMSNTGVTLTCPSTNNFYDSGGSTASYSASEGYTKTFTAPAGYCVTVSFTSFNTESCCDELSIYDGPNTSSTLLGTYAGTSTPPTFTSSGSTLTFYFDSDGSVQNAGWVATISCAAACTGTPAAGTASAAPNPSCGGTTVLSLASAATGCGITYQWQSATASGGPYSNISGATATTYTATLSSTTYYRCVTNCSGSGSSANSNTVTVTVSAPSNDNCSGAIALTPGATCSATAGDVNCASQSQAGCLGNANDDVWYSFVAGNTTQFLNLTSSGSFDAVVQVFSGSCGSLTSIWCDDATFDPGGVLQSRSITGLTVGSTYYVRIYDYYSGYPATTTFSVCITDPPTCPSGLGTVNSITIPYGSTGRTSCGAVDNITSSNVANVCGSTNYYSGEDEVFTFTPTSTGQIQISLLNTTGSTSAMLYSSCPFTGTCVANVQNSSTNKYICVNVTAGTTYYLVVDCWSTPSCTSYDLYISEQNLTTCNLNYSVATTTYSWESSLSNSINMSDDVLHSSKISLGFDFCFDGIKYSSVFMSSNSSLVFDALLCNPNIQTTTYAATGVGTGYTITSAAPVSNTSLPRNAILGPWHDIHPTTSSSTDDLKWQTLGTAPNRRFVAQFANIPMFDCEATSSLNFYGQIKLYESTNIIEIHLQKKETCTGWNNEAAVLGLHNYNGTIAVVPAGYNYPTVWTATNQAWRFTPSCAACMIVLPLDVLSLNGTADAMMNKLEWSYYNTDAAIYYVQRSADGFSFSTIGQVAGGTSLNTFNDESAPDGNSYYRIIVMDKDGRQSFSKILLLSRNTKQFDFFNVYPNPSNGEHTEVSFKPVRTDKYVINVYDLTGRLIYKKPADVKAGETFTIDLNEQFIFSKGCYTIELRGTGSKEIKKLIVN